MQRSHIDKNPGEDRFPDVTGVILAGGKSSRMGHDKASLEVNGTTLFERMLDVLQGLFPSVLIAGDRPDLIRPGVSCHPDIYPGSALGGLYTGLFKAQTDWVFVAPCDMPHVDAAPIRTLLERRSGQEIVVPRTRAGLEPLFALYHKACLEPMRSMLIEGHYRIYDFYSQMRVRYVEEKELPAGWERALVNVNTPEEYLKAKEWP